MTVAFAHATSFCGEVWRPVIDGLDGLPTVTWDFAGHGSGPPLSVPVDWRRFGDQVLSETEPGGIGVGHSMGAAALLMAQLAEPGHFVSLVLIEPIVFPGPYVRSDSPMSAVALKRKRVFPDRGTARANFTRVFDNWDPRALDGYLDGGLLGSGPLELACVPEVEADIYRASSAHDTWERLGEVNIPVLILAGELSDTTPPAFVREQASRFPRAGLEIVPGAGHFLPMENPGLVAGRVSRLVRAMGLG